MSRPLSGCALVTFLLLYVLLRLLFWTQHSQHHHQQQQQQGAQAGQQQQQQRRRQHEEEEVELARQANLSSALSQSSRKGVHAELRLQRRIGDTALERVVHANSHRLPAVRDRLGGVCNGKMEVNCVPPFGPLVAHIKMAESYKLAGCTIEKNMSTLLMAILCYLHNQTAFTSAGRRLLSEWDDDRFCAGRNEIDLFGKADSRFRSLLAGKFNGWTLLALVRDPLERFLSAFTDKCIRGPLGANPCHGCQDNMTCFLEREHDSIMRQVARGMTRRTQEDLHFFPQSWYCAFGSTLPRFTLVKYTSSPSSQDTFVRTLVSTLRAAGVPNETLAFVSAELKTGRTLHTTVQSPLRTFLHDRLTGSPYLMRLFLQIYFFDYTLFGFPLPN